MPQPAPALAPPDLAGLAPAVVRKNPVLAATLSLFPGVGNVYNGLYMRGVIFFLVIASLISIVQQGPPLFGMAIAFFWIFNVIDAYRQATLINYGYAQDLGLTDLPRHPRASQGGVVAGVLLALIGVIAIGERYFNLDVERLAEIWPFALVAIGGWLIWSSIRDRLRASAGQ
ncbi:MAG: hypothetical protein ABUL63_03535 [Acidobacteriota bacterium]